jgi:hypothetical protein
MMRKLVFVLSFDRNLPATDVVERTETFRAVRNPS